jgi:hypothetical protein
MTCLTPALCKTLREELRGFWRRDARAWVSEHEDVLVSLGKLELEAFVFLLRKGDKIGAYRLLLRGATYRQWVDERGNVTRTLTEIGLRREAAAEAFAELGWLALRALWRALRMAVGL